MINDGTLEIKSKKYTVFDYVKLPFKIMPITIIIMITLRIFVAVVPSLEVLATTSFIDTSIDIFKYGQASRIYLPLFEVIAIIGVSWLSSMILSFVRLRIGIKMKEAIYPAVVKKRNRLAYRHVENNDAWELITRVSKDVSEQFVKGFDNILNIVEYIITIGSLMIIIGSKVWWVPIAMVMIAVPLFLLAFKSGEVEYDAFVDSEKYMRKADYLKDVISSRENVEERALFGYTHAIDKMWFRWFEIARKIEYKTDGQIFIRTKIASIITAFLSMTIMLILLFPVRSKAITVGMYISLVTATFSLVDKMSWEFSLIMKEYAKNKNYMEDLTAFSALEEVEGADRQPDISVYEEAFESIEFKNVKFSYPGTEKKILNGISMRLEKNKRYAFVGKNGAGKTTITKLLTGLYNNYEGQILINGKDIKEFTQEQLKAYFSVVYQDFAQYYISLKANVLLGVCGQELSKDKKKALVESALDKMEMTEEVKKLANGIETEIGKLSEESVDLSGGQWQRVAIARTLVSNAPVYILDEPTAALDPISESKVYELFKKVSKEKTTFYITHRLGAARIADEILVVDDGIIAEYGNHDELVHKKGIYAAMFEAQRAWYDE